MYPGRHFVRALLRRKRIDVSSDTNLNRCLTTFDLTALGIGSTLGLGIYVLAGEVASRTSGPAVTISFFIGKFLGNLFCITFTHLFLFYQLLLHRFLPVFVMLNLVLVFRKLVQLTSIPMLQLENLWLSLLDGIWFLNMLLVCIVIFI